MAVPRTLVVATKNPGKAREFAKSFASSGITIHTLLDYPNAQQVNETGTSFEENARLKADHFAHVLQLPVLADDSGLMVDALHGQPGIRSARFAGDHNDAANNAKLLVEMGGMPEEQRGATFHSTLVMAWPDRPADDLVVVGETRGQILTVPRGDNQFGYDPLFFYPPKQKSFAEMSPAEKNKISHRGLALKKLAIVWPDWWQKEEAK
jgi:non-canonical purine NTP pyrophosphatase (RdgB/HAM1 family)